MPEKCKDLIFIIENVFLSTRIDNGLKTQEK